MNQEPKSNPEIKKDVEAKFGVTFPLMDKIDVNGPTAHPVFRYLRGQTKELISKKDPTRMLALPWNFCRWVVDSEGRVQMYLNPTNQLAQCYDLVEYLIVSNGKKSINF